MSTCHTCHTWHFLLRDRVPIRLQLAYELTHPGVCRFLLAENCKVFTFTRTVPKYIKKAYERGLRVGKKKLRTLVPYDLHVSGICQCEYCYYMYKTWLRASTGKARYPISIACGLHSAGMTTEFVFELREPLELPNPSEFGRFLCNSLAFTRVLASVVVFTDGVPLLRLHKALSQTHPAISLPAPGAKASLWGALSRSEPRLFALKVRLGWLYVCCVLVDGSCVFQLVSLCSVYVFFSCSVLLESGTCGGCLGRGLRVVYLRRRSVLCI